MQWVQVFKFASVSKLTSTPGTLLEVTVEGTLVGVCALNAYDCETGR